MPGVSANYGKTTRLGKSKPPRFGEDAKVREARAPLLQDPREVCKSLLALLEPSPERRADGLRLARAQTDLSRLRERERDRVGTRRRTAKGTSVENSDEQIETPLDYANGSALLEPDQEWVDDS
jgi:hypothetical protein